MAVPFKAEIRFVAARPFEYFSGQKLKRGDEVPLMGAPNDPRLLSTRLVRQEITYICRKPRCSKTFENITRLLDHETEHEVAAKKKAAAAKKKAAAEKKKQEAEAGEPAG
jgi:hypothetical protein